MSIKLLDNLKDSKLDISDLVSYKFIILKRNETSKLFEPQPVRSSHTVRIDDVEHYFTLTTNGWIYLYTNDILLSGPTSWSGLEGWQGDHFTIGPVAAAVSPSPQGNNLIKLHRTRYIEKKANNNNVFYTMRYEFCNFNPTGVIKDNFESTPCVPPREVSSQSQQTISNIWTFDDAKDPKFVKEFILATITPSSRIGGRRKSMKKGGSDSRDIPDSPDALEKEIAEIVNKKNIDDAVTEIHVGLCADLQTATFKAKAVLFVPPQLQENGKATVTDLATLSCAFQNPGLGATCSKEEPVLTSLNLTMQPIVASGGRKTKSPSTIGTHRRRPS